MIETEACYPPDLEDLLRDGMAQQVANVRYRDDLLAAAHRRHCRRRAMTRAVAGAGTVLFATVAGFVATLLVHGPDRNPAGPMPQALTVAFVSSHVQAAIAQGPESIVHVVSNTGGRMVETWEDPATHVMAVKSYNASGVLQQVSVWAYPATGAAAVVTAVDPAHQSWWTQTLPPPPLVQALVPAKLDAPAPAAVALGPPLTADLINTGLSNGRLKVLGRDVTDGQPSLHLLLAAANSIPFEHVEMWVDAATYQPVRMLTSATGAALQQVFTWLPRTQDNLEALKVQIPVGYVQQRAPAGP